MVWGDLQGVVGFFGFLGGVGVWEKCYVFDLIILQDVEGVKDIKGIKGGWVG